jgi:hypothetical protein
MLCVVSGENGEGFFPFFVSSFSTTSEEERCGWPNIPLMTKIGNLTDSSDPHPLPNSVALRLQLQHSSPMPGTQVQEGGRPPNYVTASCPSSEGNFQRFASNFLTRQLAVVFLIVSFFVCLLPHFVDKSSDGRILTKGQKALAVKDMFSVVTGRLRSLFGIRRAL